MADEPVVDADIPAASPRARKFLRLFLMVAGGLTAPCLALAAFFLSSGGDPPARPATQAGLVTATTARREAPVKAAATTTTTSAPPAVPAAPPSPLRDPFVSLVATAGPSGTPPR